MLVMQEWAINNCNVIMDVFCGKREIREGCVMSKCCSVCPTNDTCLTVCKPITDEFKIDNR